MIGKAVSGLRLDRVLANMGCGSRSDVKGLIKQGKITVNGEVIRDPGFHVATERDAVVCRDEPVLYQPFIYLMLNKPAGVISATEDAGAATVLDLVDAKHLRKGIFPVGRLDKDTEGLLILTNDGRLAHQLLAPKKHVFKEYYVKVDGLVTADDQAAVRDGIVLEDGYCTMPGKLDILAAGPVSEAIVAIAEGKFHQVKRMFLALNKRVLYLKRIAMGELRLDPGLPPGACRELFPEERDILYRAAGLL